MAAQLSSAASAVGRRAYQAMLAYRVPSVRAAVVRVLEHDPHAFTQGLTFSQSRLYESTGAFNGGKSSLRELSLCDGSIVRQIQIEDDFAEGVAVVGNCLYQLSWKKQVARIFSVPDLNLTGTMKYQGEGWGLAAAPSELLMSNGSSLIRKYDHRFRAIGKITAHSAYVPGLRLRRINDLEYVTGTVLANVWFSPFIYLLSASTGAITGILDCSELVESEGGIGHPERVLNGIAYNQDDGTFFITGKLWSNIYEIKVPEQLEKESVCAN